MTNETQTPLLTEDQAFDLIHQAEGLLARNLAADHLLASLNPFPPEAWPPLIAAAIAGILPAHPDPADLISSLHRHLADLATP
jgi:hypothetical protein